MFILAKKHWKTFFVVSYILLIVLIPIFITIENQLYIIIIYLHYIIFGLLSIVRSPKKEYNSTQIFVLRDYGYHRWNFLIVLFATTINFISSKILEWNYLNLCLVIISLIIVVISGFQNGHSLFEINAKGIRSKNHILNILKETITDIDCHEDEIAIHTTKYRNDLQIKKKNLHYPSWEDLQERLKIFKNGDNS